MGEIGSPLVKSEPNAPLLYQPYPYPPTYPALSIDSMSSSTIKSGRRPGSPEIIGEIDTSPQHKMKKQKLSVGKAGAGRGVMAGVGHSLSADEITYTPITHRISKAKKGKKVHSCTFPGCPKVHIIPSTS